MCYADMLCCYGTPPLAICNNNFLTRAPCNHNKVVTPSSVARFGELFIIIIKKSFLSYIRFYMTRDEIVATGVMIRREGSYRLGKA